MRAKYYTINFFHHCHLTLPHNDPIAAIAVQIDVGIIVSPDVWEDISFKITQEKELMLMHVTPFLAEERKLLIKHFFLHTHVTTNKLFINTVKIQWASSSQKITWNVTNQYFLMFVFLAVEFDIRTPT